MAATMAAQAGASVLLLEKLGWPGGRLGLQTQPLQGPKSIYKGYSGVEFCKNLFGDAASSGVEVCLDSLVSDIQRGAQHFALRYGAGSTVRASAVVLSTGSDEPWMEFPGARLGGVMLSGDAQTRLNVHGELPCKRAVMVGSDNAGLLIAANLLDAGAEVLAVVDESPTVIGREVNVAPLREAGVAILTSSRIAHAHGRDAVEAVTIADMNSSSRQTFEVDTVCLAGPRTPQTELAAKLECPASNHEIMGGFVPIHNRHMLTPIAGLYVCGDVSGVENGAVSLESGRIAGLSAAEDIGYAHPDAVAQEQLARARLGHLRRGRRGLLRRQAKAALASEHQRIERGL